MRDAGKFTRVLSIDISPTEVRIEAQDPENARHINRWWLVRMNIGSFNWEQLKGPEAVELNLINPDLEANLFDLAGVDFKASQALIREALARAALEDAATVTSMEIRRQLYLLPSPSSGDVRWTVNIGSGRESASLVADAKGTIVRADLAGTNRAKTLDMLKSLELLADAATAYEKTAGTGQTLIKVGVDQRGVTFETNVSNPSPLFATMKERQTYRWSLNGLDRVMGSVDTDQYFGAKASFGISETDWTLADTLARRAKEALQMPDGKVADIELAKPGDQPSVPELEWKITIEDKNRETGVARFSAKGGEVLGLLLPESRRKAFDGRDPAGWPDALAKIAAAFGGEGAIAELIIHDAHISIVALDPQNMKELGEFLLDEDGIKRFGTVSPFAEQNPRFSVADLKALDATQMRKLQEATTQRLGLATSMITSITIGRAAMDPSPAGHVTVEIRAEEGPFKRGGRVNWEIDGREIKAYLP